MSDFGEYITASRKPPEMKNPLQRFQENPTSAIMGVYNREVTKAEDSEKNI
jgi:hypothetical protein